MSGGQRLRPSIRVARLERQAAEREPGLEGLSAPERLWRRALELARSGEVEELDRLVEIASAQEPKTLELLETMLEVWALKERIMARSSPSLAAEYRAERDLPHRGLRTLEERVAQEQERWTPVRRAGISSPEEVAHLWAEEQRTLEWRRCAFATAVVNCKAALRSGLVGPVTNVAEATRVGEAISAAIETGDLDRMLAIVGSAGGSRSPHEGENG